MKRCSLINFEVELPSGRVMPYFVPQTARSNHKPVGPFGDEDAVGVIVGPDDDPKQYYVSLNEYSTRFRAEDREHAEHVHDRWRYYFTDRREVDAFLKSREL
jgi:hypothetical protein